VNDPTEQREREQDAARYAARNEWQESNEQRGVTPSATDCFTDGFYAGCKWQHKMTLTDVVAWLRANHRQDSLLADQIERGAAEGAAK
jgi:hypothetical protein